jgi:hypothetical protein
MLRRLVEQRTAVDRVIYEKWQRQDLALPRLEWNLLKPLIEMLGPCEEATKLFCKENLAVLIPYARGLVNSLQALDLRVPNDDGILVPIVEINEMRVRLINEINKRFGVLENDRFTTCSL